MPRLWINTVLRQARRVHRQQVSFMMMTVRMVRRNNGFRGAAGFCYLRVRKNLIGDETSVAIRECGDADR
jgi:hypothetical protein